MTFEKILAISRFGLLALLVSSCTNAIPTVTKLESSFNPPKVGAKDSLNFAQINAGSQRETLAGGYQGKLRISQPLADMHKTSSSGYTLKGTVTLVK